MTDDLDILADGSANAWFANVAWHRLGNVVGAAFNWLAAKEAGLDITQTVEKVPMSDLVLAYECQPDEYASLRGNRVLATGLGEQWTPFQVEDAYTFGQVIRDQHDGQADLVSLGAIDRGRKWFMTYDLGSFTIGDYDIESYLSLNGSFDSSWVFSALTSNIIQVCANTIAASRATGSTHYRFKHTSGIKARVEDARRALQRHQANTQAFATLGEKLLSTPVSGKTYGQLVEALFPVDADEQTTKTVNVNTAAVEQVTALYKGLGSDPKVSSAGNGFAFVQAVNTYENWAAPIRQTKGRSESEIRALRQIDQVISGRQALTDTAIDMVLTLN